MGKAIVDYFTRYIIEYTSMVTKAGVKLRQAGWLAISNWIILFGHYLLITYLEAVLLQSGKRTLIVNMHWEEKYDFLLEYKIQLFRRSCP